MIKKQVRNILMGGTMLGIGATVAGKMPMPAGVSTSVNSAFEIGSVALPVMAAKGVMDSYSLIETKKKGKKTKW
jgi:hypothetical protein